jgi:hypothetical protein
MAMTVKNTFFGAVMPYRAGSLIKIPREISKYELD